jgi:RNA-directed DNA polymerase
MVKKYNEEFKHDALKLASEIGVRKAGEKLNVSTKTLYAWQRVDRLAHGKECKLEVAEEKSKIIAFGKSVDQGDTKRRSGTFDFLGFTHYYGTGKSGAKRVMRKISKKKLKANLARFTAWVKQNMHEKLDVLLKRLNSKLIGNYRYYGISDNITWLKKMRDVMKRVLYRCLNRRSQRKSYT